MKSRLTASLAASVLALWVSASQADANSITADFTVKDGVVGVPSGGEVTFTLNPDGTIAASLTFSADLSIFGFDSPIELGSIPDLLPLGWEHVGVGDMYGQQHNGIMCTPTGCGTSVTWTIGTKHEFTSVFQVLNDPGSSYNFVVVAGTGFERAVWAADPVATPLPAALPLFATGLGALGLLGWRRKRKAQAV
jgi:hypothetical protein